MTIFYVVHYNRATRSLDGVEEYGDLPTAKSALEAAEVAHLGSGDEVEITLVPEAELPKFLSPGPMTLPTEPVPAVEIHPPAPEYFVAE